MEWDLRALLLLGIVVCIGWVSLAVPGKIVLSRDEIRKIGVRIWQNETGGREEYLVFWSPHEPFPSIGIGHNIWFPEGHAHNHTECFPALCAYLKRNGVVLPAWLEEALPRGAPWKSREDFYADQVRRSELRRLFADTVGLQAQFMVDRFVKAIPSLVQVAPVGQRKKVEQVLHLMLASSRGAYALIDYFNFKGDGLSAREESRGQRWGLLSVLLDMPEGLTQDNVVSAFIVAAARRLLMLIEHSAPEYTRVRWLSGWMKRLATYRENIL